MAFKPAADIFRFLGFAGGAGATCTTADIFRFLGFAGGAGCACFFCPAHLALCAAAILARPALLIVRRFCGPVGPVPAAVAFGRPGPRWPSCALMSAILAEILSSWLS